MIGNLTLGRRAAVCALGLLLGTSCDDADPAARGAVPAPVSAEAPDDVSPRVAEATLPPSARPDIVDEMRRDRDAPRDPSDGGGHAVREIAEGEPSFAIAGGEVRVSLLYTVGPLGIADGGRLFLQVPPFWGWSQPWVDASGEVQAEWRDQRPGFTTISTDAEGVTLSPSVVDEQLLAIDVSGRAMREGERVRVVYGAGEARARADRFAEHGSPFWFALDGDGDGVRRLVPDPPRIDVRAAEPAQLVLTVSSSLEPGDSARLTVALLDAAGNMGPPFEGEVELVDADPSLGLPASFTLGPDDEARRTLDFTPTVEGVFRLFAHAGQFEAVSNPLVVQARAQPILWADLQGHGALSDGTGTVEDFHTYARDVAGLDVVALTEHDHWGFPFLDDQPEVWDALPARVRAFERPGRFLPLVGYEWTNWIWGHRHVVSFEDDRPLPLLSSIDESCDTPDELWAALAGRRVLTFAHHSAGGPVATAWEQYPPDPVLEPVTEIVSVHGSSEADDTPHPIYHAVAHNFVRDELLRGVHLGFIGSGDSHDGHPGLSHLASPTGTSGLCALLTGDLSRQGVYDALSARRCYATTGARIVVRASLAGHRMGELVPPEPGPSTLVVLVNGTHLVDRIEVVRGAAVVHATDFSAEPAIDVIDSVVLDDLRAGEFVYARIVQVDGHVAWTSPFYVGDG